MFPIMDRGCQQSYTVLKNLSVVLPIEQNLEVKFNVKTIDSQFWRDGKKSWIKYPPKH